MQRKSPNCSWVLSTGVSTHVQGLWVIVWAQYISVYRTENPKHLHLFLVQLTFTERALTLYENNTFCMNFYRIEGPFKKWKSVAFILFVEKYVTYNCPLRTVRHKIYGSLSHWGLFRKDKTKVKFTIQTKERSEREFF